MTAAAEQAARMVAAVEDDPRRRLDLAGRFYADRPGYPSVTRYRRAELAFMHWQIRRGVLAAVDADQPGSPWWRAVNSGLLRDAWEADLLLGDAPGPPSRPSVARWTDFLRDPSPRSWYRAHNASIVAGYIDHRPLSAAEAPIERFFMDVTLGRVLFVQVMLLDPRLAVGRWAAPIARWAADPRSPGVNAYLSLRNVLPDEYPIGLQAITEVLDAENFMGRLLDYGIMLPRAQALYEHSAEDLQEHRLLDFICDGKLVYAWPLEDSAAWDLRKHRRLSSAVRRLTPVP